MATRTEALRRTFKALENRNYRWLWLGRLGTSGTFHMGNVVQGWLVYHLTGSAFALGWVGAGWSVAMLLLGLYGGAMADRVDKRRLIFWMRAGMLLTTLGLGLLAARDAMRVWHLALGSFANGVFSAFLMPAQQSIISDLVERDTLMNALSLDALGMGLMGILASSLAGILIDVVGPGAVYFLMVGMYAFSALTVTRLPRPASVSVGGRSAWGDLVGGARYLGRQPLLTLLLTLEMVRVLLAMPYSSMLPAFAQDDLGLDAAGLGLLQSAVGFGGLVGSLVASHLGNLKRKGRLLSLSSAFVGLSLILLVTVRSLPSVLVALAIVGGLGNLYMVFSGTLLLKHTDLAYRGRIVSMSMMAWGLMPLGTVPSGAIADLVGVPLVVSVQGALLMIVYTLVAWRRPALNDME